MTKDKKIKAAMDGLQEAVAELRRLSKDEPDLRLGSIAARTWLFATQIHLEHLDILLHDLQPTLF